MTSPRDAAVLTSGVRGELVRTFRAMASPITLRLVEPRPAAEEALLRAEAVVREVERSCSRFDAASDLSRLNAAPDRWHEVPELLAAAVEEALRAHRGTGGVFDPRILDTLLDWGYDRSLLFAQGLVRHTAARPHLDATGGAAPRDANSAGAGAGCATWRPEVVRTGGRALVHLGGQAIDLGGIGKGLAVRWAAAELAGAGTGYLVDAGGDCALGGVSPQSGRWRVGVEDPAGGGTPVLVLALTDSGCATSSVRLRRWHVDGVAVHHLVDPRTRRPGGAGLLSVTVVAPDPAWSEVESKALFLAGAAHIRADADGRGIAAAWVRDDGSVHTSRALDPLVEWRRAQG